MALEADTAALISLFIQCVLYGVFFFLFILSCYYIWEQHDKSGSLQAAEVKVLLVSATMFLLASIHIGTTFWRILDAFVWAPPNMTIDILGSVKTKAYLVRAAVYYVQTLVGDGFMIYRLYIVWGMNRLICIPVAVTLLASIATAIGALHQNVISNGNPAALHAPAQVVWNSAFPILTLFTNGYATGLIAARITYFGRIERKVLKIPLSSSLRQTAVIIIESGAIYSASLVVFITLYEVKNTGADIFFNCMPQLIGIIFSLIIVRVAAGVSHTGSLRHPTEGTHTKASTIIFRHSLSNHRPLDPIYLPDSAGSPSIHTIQQR